MESLKHILIKSAIDFYTSEAPQTLTIADLGCSCGPNTFAMVKRIIEGICKSCCEMSSTLPDFMVFLNDLPTNDFNSVFVGVPEFVEEMKDCSGASVFLAGVPGSFYGRLFPSCSLHFVCSLHSVHWLSQVPPGLLDQQGKSINKETMYITHRSPTAVVESYFNQFQRDFSLFLKSRSEELINGGRMALAMSSRKSIDCFDKNTTLLWDLLAQSFALLVSQDLVEQEKVESYNVPFYAPSPAEIEDEVEKEGSFSIDYIEPYEFSSSSGNAENDAAIITMAVRAIQESMITYHFGGGEIIEPLFQIYKGLLTEAIKKDEVKSTHLVVVLRKLP
ncbi:uncharacterized protein A4U43_C08F22170 [Asparagus officinalis]|nr:uncharacterized protein A4U43_C08F22170 [Asparagus officinalis]